MPTVYEFAIAQSTLNFPRSFAEFADPPRLAHGIRALGISKNGGARVASRLQHVTNRSADCDITTWGDTNLYGAVASVFALAQVEPKDLDFLTGEHMYSRWVDFSPPSSVRVDFERPFSTPPKVVVFLNYMEFEKGHNWRVMTTATDIDVNGFTLDLKTWSDTSFNAAQAGWIAYPEDRGQIFSTSVNTTDVPPSNQRPAELWSGKIKLNTAEFRKKPSVFIALNSLDIGCKSDLRVKVSVSNVTTTGLVWHIETWSDTVFNSAGATIIAFN